MLIFQFASEITQKLGKGGREAQRSLMKHKSSQTHILMKHTRKPNMFGWNTSKSETHFGENIAKTWKGSKHQKFQLMFEVIHKLKWVEIEWYFFTFNISNPLCWHSMSDTLTFYSGPFGFNSSLKYFEWEFGMKFEM